MDPFPRTWATIDLVKLAANLQAVRSFGTSGTQFALVCKADAYGHGLGPVGRFAALNGADWLAVATVQEGVTLRDAGVAAPIMVMSPLLPVEADQAVFYRLDTFVESAEMAKVFSVAATNVGRSARVHIKVDTGLHRFGCDPVETESIVKEALAVPNIDLVGIGQHFVDSSTNPQRTAEQSFTFQSLVKSITAATGHVFAHVHACNSAGHCSEACPDANLARIGILAYGVDPYNLTNGAVQPILSWFSRVTSIRTVPPGDTVSYNGTWTASRQSRLATLGLGYGDGYPRNLSNKGFVWLHGQRAPVVGLVCMDQTVIDVTDIPQTTIGDTVEVVGANVPVPELARSTGTNSHEILTRIMSRVSRRYIYPNS